MSWPVDTILECSKDESYVPFITTPLLPKLYEEMVCYEETKAEDKEAEVNVKQYQYENGLGQEWWNRSPD